MVKIRVTCGGCGIEYTDEHGNVRHVLKTVEDAPFLCDAKQAERLVGLDVAVYVDAPAADDKKTEQLNEGRQPETVKGHIDAEQLATMTNEQLKSLAGDLGVDVTGCKKKADYIAAIVTVEVDAPAGEDEMPPAPGVVDPE